MAITILTLAIQSEIDVVGARQRARRIATLCGFGTQDQVRIATSVSELARNVFNYAGSGKVHFVIEGETAPQILTIRIEDKGPGIAQLDAILAGNYQSSTGMGKGILGARRLMDRFDIKTGDGTDIVLQKIFPRDAPLLTPKSSNTIFSQLASLPTDISMAEVLQQNQELLGALAELKARQDDLLQLTHELEDTNRGVVALYAELDEKADHLRRADEMKSRFLSNMSHEFRTPLSSIRALAKLLLDGVDGELSVEQEKQVMFILQGAVGLTELVNDLLDLAKIEAGKIEVHPQVFDVSEMFSALRGMLRPLLVAESLALNFIEPETPIDMYTDEAKLSQILRNFIANSLKFTEAGAITVRVSLAPEEQQVTFSVTDTGLGIEAHDLKLIFEEFSQLENPMQRKVKGTGLGLPLCRNLAHILGGEVSVDSQFGAGSTFAVTIPRCFAAKEETLAYPGSSETIKDQGIPVLVVEDNASMRLLYEKFLSDTEFKVITARTIREAVGLWRSIKPAAVILDIVLCGEDSWSWMAELKSDPAFSHVPVILATEVEDKRKGLSLGADAYYVKPLSRQQLVSTLRTLVGQSVTTQSQPG